MEYYVTIMWEIETTHRWEKDHKHYEKKRPDELAAVTNNLHRYLKILEVSKNSKCVQAGYLHPEPGGVVAIDQKAGGGNLQETRLYTYADDETRILYLLTIGDKAAQDSDIEYCKSAVNELRRQKETNEEH